MRAVASGAVSSVFRGEHPGTQRPISPARLVVSSSFRLALALKAGAFHLLPGTFMARASTERVTVRLNGIAKLVEHGGDPAADTVA